MSRFALISFSLLLIFGLSTRGQEPRAGNISFEPYSFKTYDQQEHPAQLGKLWVTENRSKKNGRLIQLAFVRLKTTAANPQPPIVFLAGGPGVPGTGMERVPVYFYLFARLQEVADVILLDQRGTGLSTPNLQCPPSKGLAPDTWEAKEKATQALVELVHACAEHWRAQGVDLAAFTRTPAPTTWKTCGALWAQKASHFWAVVTALNSHLPPFVGMESTFTALFSHPSKGLITI